MSLDVSFKTDTAQVASHEASLQTLRTNLDGWIESANRARTSALGAWQGEAADAFDARARKIDEGIQEVLSALDTYLNAVTTFHGSASSVKDSLQQIKDEALAAGLMVAGDIVYEPRPPQFIGPPGASYPTAEESPLVAAYERQKSVYLSLQGRVDEARSSEAQAHNALQRGCDQASAPSGWDFAWAALGIPTTVGAGFFFAAKLAPDAADLTGTAALQRFGRFAYREGGKYATLPPGLLAQLAATRTVTNWQNLPNATSSQRWWVGFGKGAKGFASRATVPVTLLFAGWDAWQSGSEQWERDSHDPTLSTSARVSRASIEGVSDVFLPTLGGTLGAAGGAIAGATIGSVVPIVGTAVGGVIGGIVGGFLGGWAGQTGTDATDTMRKEWVDEKVRW